MAAAAVAAVLALHAGRGEAATAAGTLITNVATATMTSGFPDYVAYEVSYNASVMVIVLSQPVVSLTKLASTPLCAAGCTVTFSVCVGNMVADTVWAITLTDVLPGNMAFVADDVADYNTTSVSLGAIVPTNAAALAGPWNAGGPTAGQLAVWYLRWVIPGIGPARSACVTYSARIL
jgi:uncharacterized repeat protein (TIGR01451 family)